jgi:pyruvate dehydrogenase E1 component beta subunit
MAIISYREALRAAMRENLKRDENVVLMGEEVAQFRWSL